MKTRIVSLAAALLSFCGFTQEEVGRAEQAVNFFAGEFQKCLAAETQRLLATKISSQDFAVLIRVTCPAEKSKFLVSFADYLAMRNGAITPDATAIMAQAKAAIWRYQDAAVKNFIETKSGR